MKDYSPYIFRIQRYSIHDGPGIRTTLFFQGCPLSCPWCHNPESQSMAVPSLGPAQEADMARDLVREIEKDMIYFDESNGGVTFSGGEPLCCPGLLMTLLGACREREIHTCLDTSGCVPFDILEPAANAADLVLYDIKIHDEKKHQDLLQGSSGRVLGNLEKLSECNIPVTLRFPLIPTMTDSLENINGLIDFLIHRTSFRDIHILPYHNTGAGKYEHLNRENPMGSIAPPGPEQIEAAVRLFDKNGFHTSIGG